MKPLARGPVRVHIGTTEGPAEVQRLTQEAPEIRSVVCLDGRAVALPISRDYESFVRRPTGLIERLWGGPSFRLDVGARITDGLSWQLGAFLAHALKAAGRLAERGKDSASVVWATGEVDAALAVRPVEQIARKLELSVPLLRGLAAQRPLILVPADAADLARATIAAQGLAETCRVLGVRDAAEALASIGLALPGARPARTQRPVWIAAAIAALILLPAGATTAWKFWGGDAQQHPHLPPPPPQPQPHLADAQPPASQPAAPTPPTASPPPRTPAAQPPADTNRDWRRLAESGDLIGLDDQLTRLAQSPDCGSCAAEIDRFRTWLGSQAPPPGTPVVTVDATRRSAGCMPGEAPPATLTLGEDAGDAIPTSSNVCQVRYVASGAPHVGLILSAPQLARGADQHAAGLNKVALTLDIPVVACCLNEQRIVALGAPWPLDRLVDWLAPQLSPGPAPLPAAVIARLASLGVAVRVLPHRIDLREPH